MKKACLFVDGYLNQNRIFNASLHRDNFVDRFVKLKEAFKKRQYDLSTQDINSVEESEVVIYASNMPDTLPKPEHIKKSYIFLSESPFVKPGNYDREKHRYFNRVFTWLDDLVDGENYVKLNHAHSFPERISKDLSQKEKLCILIGSNKKPPHSIDESLLELDLYHEREKAIRWFENNHLEDFDLYGVGWDKYRFSGPRIIRALNRVPCIPQLMMKVKGEKYPSYRGQVAHKKPVMEKYWFSICYENARDIPGYITEKIFDSFFASCVPIYWGANNITDYIPGKCFIDKRNFSSYGALYEYMKSMSESEYLSYLDNIENYLNSHEAFLFKSESFVQTLMVSIFDNHDGVKD